MMRMILFSMKKIKELIPIVVLTVIILVLIILLNPNSGRYEKLMVKEDKWSSIIEQRSENDELVLENIKFNDYSLIIDEEKDTVYYSLVNESKTKYNPKVSFEASSKGTKLVALESEITDEKIHSNYEFQMMIYDSKEYHIYRLVCTDFPILSISYQEEVVGKSKEKNIPIDIYLFNNLENASKRVTKSNGKLDIIQNAEGESEYRFELFMQSPGRNRRDNPVSVFNMDPHNAYILKQSNVDEEPGRSYKVEVFINNEYQGQYSLEHMNRR